MFSNFQTAWTELKRNGLITLQGYTLFHQTGSNELLTYVQKGEWTQIRQRSKTNLIEWRSKLPKSNSLSIFLLSDDELYIDKNTTELLKSYYYFARSWSQIYKKKKQIKDFYDIIPNISIGNGKVKHYLCSIINFIDYLLSFPDDFSIDEAKPDNNIKTFNNYLNTHPDFEVNKIRMFEAIICEPIPSENIPFKRLEDLTWENIDKIFPGSLKQQLPSIFPEYDQIELLNLLKLVLRHYIAYKLTRDKMNQLLDEFDELEKIIGI